MQLSTAWWRQEVSDRFSLVYQDGAAFTSTAPEHKCSIGEVQYQPSRELRGSSRKGSELYAEESVAYDRGVVVGIEGDIAMTEILRLVPGIRLTAASSRWILQPAIGLHRRF